MTLRSGNVFIVVAPSGAGKSSLVGALLESRQDILLSISCTTRAPRAGEAHGQHYHFVTRDQFEAMRANNDLLEWALVHSNYYGTPRAWIEAQTALGHDVLLEIDWQGARQIRQSYPESIGIFILPPSLEALEERLRNRGQDTSEVIARRLLAAGSELAHASECDYVIINQDFDAALAELNQIVSASRLRFRSQAARHAELFSSLGVS
ncbi:MAG: guanylate kinase [Pigmentiphaga sp.]|nr:guanylate kinase [Pigmentiphaga sp.]